jgi:hypothetical protein
MTAPATLIELVRTGKLTADHTKTETCNQRAGIRHPATAPLTKQTQAVASSGPGASEINTSAHSLSGFWDDNRST